MAEKILARVARLLSGKVEDAVDRMEQAGGETVMREAIREVDRTIDDVRSDYDAAAARRLQAARQQKLLADRVRQLDEKARFALAEGRADLAEAAVSRQIDFEQESAKLDQLQAQAREEEERLETSLAALKSRKQQMDDALAAFLVARHETTSHDGGGSATRERSVEKQVARSEKAFERAMAGAGGVGFTRADADTINRVAEIDGLQRSATIADRLAKLKQANEAV